MLGAGALNAGGSTPTIITAAYLDLADLVEPIAKAGADLDVRHKGWTALMHAVDRCFPDVVEVLLKCGAAAAATVQDDVIPPADAATEFQVCKMLDVPGAGCVDVRGNTAAQLAGKLVYGYQRVHGVDIPVPAATERCPVCLESLPHCDHPDAAKDLTACGVCRQVFCTKCATCMAQCPICRASLSVAATVIAVSLAVSVPLTVNLLTCTVTQFVDLLNERCEIAECLGTLRLWVPPSFANLTEKPGATLFGCGVRHFGTVQWRV